MFLACKDSSEGSAYMASSFVLAEKLGIVPDSPLFPKSKKSSSGLSDSGRTVPVRPQLRKELKKRNERR